jgi:predicted DNA-binding protein (MmcQ/YjbR family)
LDDTKQNSFVLSTLINVDSDMFSAASLKTDSINMEIIEQFKEKKQKSGVNVGKHLNKMMWSQALRNGTGF